MELAVPWICSLKVFPWICTTYQIFVPMFWMNYLKKKRLSNQKHFSVDGHLIAIFDLHWFKTVYSWAMVRKMIFYAIILNNWLYVVGLNSKLSSKSLFIVLICQIGKWKKTHYTLNPNGNYRFLKQFYEISEINRRMYLFKKGWNQISSKNSGGVCKHA